MKIPVVGILLFAMVAACATAAPPPVVPAGNGELTVTVNYADTAQGVVRFAVYAGEENFLRKPFAVAEATLTGGVASGVFENLPWGEYAVSAYLDLDADGELDSVWFGAPAEPVGTSNEAKGSFGPPNYADARFVFAAAALAIGFTLECPVGCE